MHLDNFLLEKVYHSIGFRTFFKQMHKFPDWNERFFSFFSPAVLVKI